MTEYQLIGVTDDGTIGDLLRDSDQKDARIRLQALIAQWLQMENLVVLTGAGTSVSAGGKTMASLEGAVLDTLSELPGMPASIPPIIEARRTATGSAAGSGSTALGFEAWLSYVSNALVVTRADGIPFQGVVWPTKPAPTASDLQWFVDRLRSAILGECALSLPEIDARSASDIPPQLAFLAKLVARDSSLGRTHLFTLNYDTLFEQALEVLGIQYFDGFTGRADARFDPSVYGLDVHYPGEVAEGRVRRYDKFLQLYKLHGSIHWFEQGGEMRARHPNLGPLRKYGKLGPIEKAKQLEALAAMVPSVGILPTANKFAETLAMPYAHLFRSFQVRLSVPQTFLLILGYGFGDDHVTRILETALMNPSLVMLVVEPDPRSPTIERVRRYRDLGKRAFVLCPTSDVHAAAPFTRATFDDFARQVMPDVQWLDDFLKLRKFERQIQASTRSPTDALEKD